MKSLYPVCFMTDYISAMGLMCVQCNSAEPGQMGCIEEPPLPSNCTTCLMTDTYGNCQSYVFFSSCVVIRTLDMNGERLILLLGNIFRFKNEILLVVAHYGLYDML